MELRAWDQRDPSGGDVATACSVDGQGRVTGLESGGDCFIHARFLAIANQVGASDWANISGSSGITITDGVMSGMSWSPSQSAAIVGSVVTFDPVNLGSHPSTAGATAAYATVTSSCTIDSEARTVSATAAANCVITAVVSKDDYADFSSGFSHTVAFAARTGNTPLIEWAGYADQRITWGDAAPALEAPTVDPGSAVESYSSGTTSVCTVDAESGALTILTAGTCAITLTAVEDPDGTPLTSTQIFNLVVAKKAQAVLAAADLYSVDTLQVGESADLTGGVTSAGEGDLQLQSTDTSVCSVETGAFRMGRITAEGGGTCHVQMRWSGSTNYLPSNWVSITGEAGISVEATAQNAPSAWDEPWGYNPVVRAGMPGGRLQLLNSAPANPNSDGGAVQYHVKSGEDFCEVLGDGSVVGLAPGTCVIEVRFRGNTDYNPSAWVELASIGVLPGRLLSFDTIPTLAYAGAGLQVGENNEMTPSGLPLVDESTPAVNVAWRYITSDACQLTTEAQEGPFHDDDTNPNTPDIRNPDNGKVEISPTASAGDNCEVFVTGMAVTNAGVLLGGFLPYSLVEEVTLLVAGTTFTSIAWNDWAGETENAEPSGTVDFSGKLPVSSPVADDYEFAATGGCAWDDGTSVLTFRSDAGACTITVTAKKSGYEDYDRDFSVAVANVITVTAPAYTAALRVGGSAITPSTAAAGTLNDNSAATILYSAQGKRGGTDTASICSINTSNGAVTPGSAARTGDVCQVTATYSGTGHHSASRSVDLNLCGGSHHHRPGKYPQLWNRGRGQWNHCLECCP